MDGIDMSEVKIEIRRDLSIRVEIRVCMDNTYFYLDPEDVHEIQQHADVTDVDVVDRKFFYVTCELPNLHAFTTQWYRSITRHLHELITRDLYVESAETLSAENRTPI